MMKGSGLTFTDQFCGAGGWAQGVQKFQRQYGGEIAVKLALNHWKLATETYATNNPHSLVDCTDISACDPRRYPRTNVLITSPECTTHSPSGGNKHKKLKDQMELFEKNIIDPATERSRATMWDVCRFAEYHQYEAIILENVVEAKTNWVLFDDWLRCMHRLGYLHECVYLNSQHFWPTPQSRDRMYIVFWKRGNKKPNLNYTPLAYSPRIGKDVHAVQSWKPGRSYGKYKKQYVYCCPVTGDVVEPYYYAAFNCIDWSIPTQRIGDRETPLSGNTMLRVQYGLDKFGTEPFLADSSYLTKPEGHVKAISETVPSQTTYQSQSLLHYPFIIDDKHTTGIECRVRHSLESTSTIHTDPRLRLMLPFMTKSDNTANPEANVRYSLEPGQTQTTADVAGVCVPPFIVEMKGTSTARQIHKSLSCLTTTGYHALVSNDKMNAFLAAYNNGSHCVNHITETTGTMPTKERFSLVQYDQELKAEDCHFRMLKAHEIQSAMAFNDDYIILGNQKHKIKQLGNAVTPPVAEWLIGQVVETLN